ncbi:hypothetical protein NHX12_020772 [Muraenolepis orangiensis]|uniref:SAM domain-containing protein n=1 Tax=Muraenolepis orangiensis TaxID=630683 RepID=A0A9Q0EXP9_9TELE|nr:hypothetical protein NHX12_020772 [Muraenolepis orangiensis]
MEMLQMKSGLESLMSANREKERRIEELLETVSQYRKVQELLKEKLSEADYDDIPDPPSVPVAMETAQVAEAMDAAGTGRSSGESIPCIAVLSEMNALDRERQQATESSPCSPQSSRVGQIPTPSPDQSNNKEGSSSPTLQNDSFGSKKMRSSFGRGFFFKTRGGKRTTSAPNLDRSRSASVPMLAEAEEGGTDHLDLAGTAPQRKSTGGAPPPGAPGASPDRKKNKGLRKFFGSPADAPFAQWTNEQVCGWLQAQGLGMYVAQGQGWITSGQTLLQASQHEVEKELCIRNLLHRKKLQLALQALGGSEEDDLQGKLNHHWVTRWLDDIGLPQYKSQFDEACVDGRMLHYMTVDDLLSLKVGSVLHHLSIKRAVQVLRLNLYEPNCLRRRPSDENNITPAEIAQWTNHRVMEWLRSVDLAEYAPNLRGSGVHGGLMTLALLLNIPPSKTLLRRHLATHFHLLVGPEAQRSKQDSLENPDYALLTATARIKPRRLSFGGFGSLRRKQPEDHSDYVCPMDVEMPKNASFQHGLHNSHYGGPGPADQLQQMEDSEGTVRELGVFSEEMNNLTVSQIQSNTPQVFFS